MIHDTPAYLSHDDVTENGVKIKVINTNMKLGETSVTVYAFEKSDEIESGKIELVNSNTYQATKYSAVFAVKSNKSYEVADDSEIDETRSGRLIWYNVKQMIYSLLFDIAHRRANNNNAKAGDV